MATPLYVGTVTIDLTQSDVDEFHNWCAASALVECMTAGTLDITALPIRFISRHFLPPGVFVVPDKNGVPLIEYSRTEKGKQR